MIEFFKTLKKVEEARGSGTTGLSFLGTHPATDERMRALADRWEGLERKTGFQRWSDSAVPHLEPPVDSAK
jgi:predicted Zn-dependent protease